MKRLSFLFIILSLFLVPASARCALVLYDMEGGYANHCPPAFVDPNASATDFTGNNGYQGYTGGNPGNAVIENDWNQSDQATPANYFTFSVQPKPGYALNLTTVTFDEEQFAHPGMQWALRSSLDSFAADLGGGAISSAPSVFDSHTVNVGVADITAAVEFRLYAYDAADSSDQWVVDNVAVNGTAAAVPEPAALGLLAVGSVGLLARRRRRPRPIVCEFENPYENKHLV